MPELERTRLTPGAPFSAVSNGGRENVDGRAVQVREHVHRQFERHKRAVSQHEDAGCHDEQAVAQREFNEAIKHWGFLVLVEFRRRSNGTCRAAWAGT